MSLSLLGGVILGVLAQVSLVSGFSNGGRCLGALYRLKLLEFGHELVVAFL